MQHWKTLSGLAMVGILLSGCSSARLPVSPQRVGPSFNASAALRNAPAGYYDQVKDLQGRMLLQSLSRVVGPHKNLGYDAARDAMFSEVDDLDNNNIVECDYTNRELSHVKDRHSAFQNGKGFNAEHTWPQSKGAVGAAKADLHHLFPTDIDANSRRGSFPFGEVVSVQWTGGGSKLGKDARGRMVFEPRDDQKGNTARALFYFYAVYGNSADKVNFKVEEPVLLKWHAQDPVTALDRARNDAVYRYQGNRNPFIDVPEFVSRVGRFVPTEPDIKFFSCR